VSVPVGQVLTHECPAGLCTEQIDPDILMCPRPVLSLIPIAARPSGHQVQSRLAERPRSGAGGGLDGFWWKRIIPAAGSGTSPLPLFKHPARGFALVSTPRAGLVSPAMTRRSCTDEH